MLSAAPVAQSGVKTSASSPQPSAAIDSNQMLALCQNTRNLIDTMDKGIRKAQLRLRTLNYIRREQAADCALKCLDELVELCNLSRLLIRSLDELHLKLAEGQLQRASGSMNYQIASQQLVYFTSEWYENLQPRLSQTLELADEQDIDAMARPAGAGAAPEPRLRDALLRLRQSMGENERLIASIANNIDYTRTTVEAIYDSLQCTRLGLEAGQRNALGAIEQLRRGRRRRLLCWFALAGAALLVALYLVYALAKLVL